MFWSILNDGNQLIGVLLILAGAVGYLALYYRRTLKGGGCGCGCSPPPKRMTNNKLPPDTNKSQPFVPLESLAERAARVRENQEDTKPKDKDDPPSS